MITAVAGFFQKLTHGRGLKAFSWLDVTAGKYPDSRIGDTGFVIPQL
jgi:hypothetical protein